MHTVFRPILRTAFAAAVLVVLAGCGAQPGTTLVKYERADTGDRFTRVPDNGTAALYGSNDASPQIRYPVSRGDQIGFRDTRDGDSGNVIAVAGDNEFPIEAGVVFDRTFYWKFQK